MRYTVSLQDITDLCCYKDFYDSNKLEDAKEKADETAEKNQRAVIVFDNKYYEIVYKKVIEKKEEAKAPPKKRGRQKKEEAKKDKYFD